MSPNIITRNMLVEEFDLTYQNIRYATRGIPFDGFIGRAGYWMPNRRKTIVNAIEKTQAEAKRMNLRRN